MLQFFLLRWKMDRLWKEIFSKSDSLLDVGCGTNPLYHRIIPSTIFCTDIQKTKKTQAVSNAEHLPFKKSSFDGVLSVNALYYCKDPKKAVGEFSRVLKKGKTLALVTPFIYPIHDAPYDNYRFTSYGIRQLLNDDFRIEKIIPIGGIFNIPALLIHSLMKGIPLLFPKAFRPALRMLSFLLFIIPSILAQLLSILDVLDRSGRWATYYFTIAKKK